MSGVAEYSTDPDENVDINRTGGGAAIGIRGTDNPSNIDDGLRQIMADLKVEQVARVSATPVGSEMPWHKSTPPDGWYEQDGSSLDPLIDPLLIAHLGSATLPDMRAEVPRGWDNGRGVDTSRVLGSAQLDAFQGHNHVIRTLSNDVISYLVGDSNTGNGSGTAGATRSRSFVAEPDTNGNYGTVRIASETRSRNVAKMWIIKHD